MGGDGGNDAGVDQVGADEEEKRDEAMESDLAEGTTDFFAEKKIIAAEKTDGARLELGILGVRGGEGTDLGTLVRRRR